MSKGGHRREVRQTHRNRGSTSFGRHIRKRPNVGTLASSIVGNEFEVLPFPKFAPRFARRQISERWGFWAVRNRTLSSRYGVSRLPCVKGAVSVVIFGIVLQWRKTSSMAENLIEESGKPTIPPSARWAATSLYTREARCGACLGVAKFRRSEICHSVTLRTDNCQLSTIH